MTIFVNPALFFALRRFFASASEFVGPARIVVPCRPNSFQSVPETQLAAKEVFDCLLHHFATGVGNEFRKRDIFGTDLHAVLREATFLDAAIAHERAQAFMLQRFAGGMLIEQADLGDRRRADKAGTLVELWTGFHAAAARDAA